MKGGGAEESKLRSRGWNQRWKGEESDSIVCFVNRCNIMIHHITRDEGPFSRKM